jgi:lipopolysaccharide export system protein LptA
VAVAVTVAVAGIGEPVPAAQAQGLGFGGATASGPIEVLADNGIEWQQDRQRFVARGNAQASRGTVTLRSDELVAYYDTAGGDISRLEAHGNVRITSPSEEATGDDAEYDVAASRLVLTGDPVRLKTPREVLTAKRRLTYDVAAHQAVAEGGATIDQGKRTLRAATLVAHLREVEGKTELSTVDAQGGVVITTENETARGSQGNYNAKTGIATLTGSVTLTRGPNVLTGTKAVVNMRTGVSTLHGGGGDGKARAVLSPAAPAPQHP